MVDSTPDLFKPVSDSEEQLLVEELKAFEPDFIGVTVVSGLLKISGEVNTRLRKYFDCPAI